MLEHTVVYSSREDTHTLISCIFCHYSSINFLMRWYNLVNPLTPMSDQVRISPYNINTISARYGMSIKKNINLGVISWSNTKFSELTLWELYGWYWGELKIWSGIGVKGLST